MDWGLDYRSPLKEDRAWIRGERTQCLFQVQLGVKGRL